MSERAASARTRDGGRKPDASMSLLNDLMNHTLDEDYVKPDDRPSRKPGEPRRWGSIAGVVVALFGLLVVMAVLETRRAAPAEAEERGLLIERIEKETVHVDTLRGRIDTLEQRVAELQAEGRSDAATLSNLNARLMRLGMQAGTVAVTGPGMVITVDDAPDEGTDHSYVLDTDLQALVNGLWVAGAEAVSINGERITSATPIRNAGSTIHVNYHPVSPPYEVRAIGSPDTMPAALLENPGGLYLQELEFNYGIVYTPEVASEVTVPGGGLSRPWPRYADVAEEAS